MMLKKFLTLLMIALLAIPAFAQDDEEVDTTDWETYEAGDITLSVPADWVDLTGSDDVATVLAELAELNPELSTLFTETDLSMVDIMLLDPLSGANVNIITIDLGVAGVTLDELEPVLISQYEQLGLSITAIERVDVGSLDEALRVDLETVMDVGSGESMISQYQLIVLRKTGVAFTITFSSGNGALEDYEDVFDAIVDSMVYTDEVTEEGDENTAVTDGDMTTYSNDGVTLSVPAGWVDVRNEDALIEAGVNALADSNAEMATILETAASQDFALFLLDPETTANLNVLTQASPGPVTLDQLESLLPGQYESFGISVVDTQTVELPAGDALRFQLEVEVSTDVVVSQFQYILILNDNFYFLTMGLANSSEFEDFVPVFEAIAESLEIE